MSTGAAKQELPTEEKAIVASLAGLGQKVTIVFAKANRIKIAVTRDNLIEVARFVRDQLHFDHATNVTGTDYPKEKQVEITYHFGSIDGEGLRRIIFAMGCKVPYGDTKLPTLVNEFPSVNYHERETAEMIGCVFEGHPNLTRFMLPEDWNDIPPLLKAYRLPGRLEGE